MLSAFYNYLRSIHPLSPQIFADLDNYLEIVQLPKNEMLLRNGEVCNYTYIMLQGLARIYYIQDAEEISCMFVENGDFFIGTDSYYSRKPGDLNIQILQASTIVRIHHNTLQRLYEKHPQLNYVGRVLTENYFQKSEERLSLIRMHTAKERYLLLLQRYPNIIAQIPLKFIASYISVAVETLSRIRSKISK